MMNIGDGRFRRGRAVRALLLAGFAFSTAVSPLMRLACPAHAAHPPIATATSDPAPSSAHAGHAPDEAPRDHDHGAGCSCMGDCCPGASAGLPGLSQVAVVTGPALKLDVTPRIEASPPSRSPWLLPFANGPPAVS